MNPPLFANGAEARRIVQRFPSYRDFVDDALFHPLWGYYSTGKVRFGEGGHYDTFPLALSPLFGRMVAHYAYRFWRRAGQPAYFEICELGAGNGQLALDVLVNVDAEARQHRTWSAFARAMRYRIIERSPGLIVRQRQQLGPLSVRVTWTPADLGQRGGRGVPFSQFGVVIANEVLDCLAHHKVVRQPDGSPGVVFVVPSVDGRRTIPRSQLAKVMGNERLRAQVAFEEVVVPVQAVPSVAAFLRRHYPEFFQPGSRFKPYFACPAIETMVRNVARLYWISDMLWIDYGATRQFHLTSREDRRVFAGPPRSGASIYRAPGFDDITFLVDFSVVAKAAEQAGLQVTLYSGQGELARRSGVQLDRQARDLILRYRSLDWMLAVIGVGAERDWRHTGLTWDPAGAKGGRLRVDVNKAVAEFVGKRSSNFKLMILSGAGRP